MKRLIASIGLSVVVAAPGLPPAAASWVSENCYFANHSTSPKTRGEARAYAYVAAREGYQWAGGCWNDNDTDDSPGDPPGDPSTNGEGPDCSGLTFKSWHLKDNYGQLGWHWWSRWQDEHGPYGTFGFRHPPAGGPFFLLGSDDRGTTDMLDAWVRNDGTSGHIGMLYSNLPPSDNTDYIIEAAGESAGTGIFVRAYRYDSRYLAIRRRNWAPPCPEPPCGLGPVVIVP